MNFEFETNMNNQNCCELYEFTANSSNPQFRHSASSNTTSISNNLSFKSFNTLMDSHPNFNLINNDVFNSVELQINDNNEMILTSTAMKSKSTIGISTTFASSVCSSATGTSSANKTTSPCLSPSKKIKIKDILNPNNCSINKTNARPRNSQKKGQAKLGKSRSKETSNFIEDSHLRSCAKYKRKKTLFKKALQLSLNTGTKVGILILDKKNQLSTYFSDNDLKNKVTSLLANDFSFDDSTDVDQKSKYFYDFKNKIFDNS